jgi:small glutamine-rich tetratricopeptide repeat-containing protein alpha
LDSAWDTHSVAASTHTYNAIDLDEAERLKSQGNAHMQKKEYQEAADAYTAALKLSPAGPQSHVYFSNRAASLLSTENVK